jgi:hypothetical protein
MRNADAVAPGLILVVQAILAGDEGGLIYDRCVIAGLAPPSPGHRACRACRDCPSRSCPAGPPSRGYRRLRLICRNASSMAEAAIQYGSMSPYLGVDAVGNNYAPVGIEHRPDYGCIAGTIAACSHERLENAASLHLMIVLAYHPFLGADIPRAQYSQQVKPEIGGLGESPAPDGAVAPTPPLARADGMPSCRNSISISPTELPS